MLGTNLYNRDWQTTNRGHIFNDQVDQLMGIAKRLAEMECVQERRRGNDFPLVIQDRSINIGSRNITVNNNRREERREVNDLTILIGGFIGLFTMGYFTFKSGVSSAEHSEATKKLDAIEDLTEAINQEMQQLSGVEFQAMREQHLSKITKLMDDTTQLSAALQRSASWDLALKVALAFAGFTLFSGAASAYLGKMAFIQLGQYFMTAGSVMGALFGSGLLFKWGVDAANERHLNRQRREIANDLAAIRRIETPYIRVQQFNLWGLVLSPPSYFK
jgi:hypothetical protein